MVKITPEPLSPQLIINNVKRDDCGAIVSFVGTVRDNTQGRKVAYLEIQPSDDKAEVKLTEVADEVKKKWRLKKIAIWRRTGKLKAGEIALVVAVAAPHRPEAFHACQHIIDRIKEGNITTEKEIYEG
jgi:molybdopterin synthase catalytic subunit